MTRYLLSVRIEKLKTREKTAAAIHATLYPELRTRAENTCGNQKLARIETTLTQPCARTSYWRIPATSPLAAEKTTSC